ncbi:MAG TPA: hypothetical protein VMW40_00555 [Candidatus Bathyarchaeia archaeon]|nr:hypothetical protein [Candidatus Bathyarchaeia archaeon]
MRRRITKPDPEEHVSFTWVKGEPSKEGSIGRFEAYLHGKLHTMDVVYTKIVPNREIEFRITHPIWRIFYTKNTLTIEQKGDYCIFTATTYFRLGQISARSKRVKKRLEAAQRRVKEERGENLKRILGWESIPLL